MSLLASLLVLIVAARLLGRLFERYNQPALIGEILAGILLGPGLFNLIQPNVALTGVTELAIFLIILNAGLEIRFSDIFDAMKERGMLLASLSFFLPFIGGIVVAKAYYQADFMRMIFLGLCISITALPVTIKLLDSFDILNTRIARYAIATSVVNDVAALFVLGIILNMPDQLALPDVTRTIGFAMLKLAMLAIAVLSMNRLLKWLHQKNRGFNFASDYLRRIFGTEALFGIVVIFVLTFGTISEALGFQFLIGAFFGALLLDKRIFSASHYEDLRKTLTSITSGFLAPIFFAFLGLKFQIQAITDWWFPMMVVVVSISTKLIAGWWGGRIIGMKTREAIGLGCVLNGRGVMELIVAGIAYDKGFIGPRMFSTLVLMGILTTFLTPIFFKHVYPETFLARYREKDT